jgi:CDP-diacylglycerol--glycerol-3-phosphate 3-phosphatidyltransferase
MTLKSLPNLITGARIALAFAVFVMLAVARESDAATGRALILAALVIFIIAALTDFIDGWLARKLGATSKFGATLDPIADKIALVAAGVGLSALDPGLALWPSALMLSREILVSGLRESGVRLAVTRLAKWKTTVQLVAYAFALFAQAAPEGRLIARPLLWAAVVITLWTGFDYLRKTAEALKDQG